VGKIISEIADHPINKLTIIRRHCDTAFSAVEACLPTGRQSVFLGGLLRFITLRSQ
jgi:hypothetical protein